MPIRGVGSRHDVVMSKYLAFYKGSDNVASSFLEKGDWDGAINRVRKDLGDVLNSKNLSFLIGSGCSSHWSETTGGEVGIPTMGPMASRFLEPPAGEEIVTGDERSQAKRLLGLDLADPRYAKNLETLMEVLYGYRFVLEHSGREDLLEARPLVESLISKVTQFVLETCRSGPFSESDTSVQKLYESFYRKLVHRDRALPRPWVFTTNYDLFSETAMDRLGIPYINGFQGSVERRFNPAIFRYTLAEQLDLSSRRWSSVDSLIYFAKLHGSVSWESREDGLFPVVETSPKLVTNDNLLIYPTPAKQNASFASPYSDMFRELQTRVAREQSAFVTLGYSFSDEHVNNIIFQALTIPTFRLIAFVDPSANATISRLRELDDPRVWIVGTDSQQICPGTAGVNPAITAAEEPVPSPPVLKQSSAWRAHYFATIVNEFMAADVEDDANSAIEKVLDAFIATSRAPAEEAIQ